MHLCTKDIDNALKPLLCVMQKRARGYRIYQEAFEHPCRRQQKRSEKPRHSKRGYSQPGGPAMRTTTVIRPHSFATPPRKARTTRTKRKRRRNETDLPVTGGGQANLSLLNLRFALRICLPVSQIYTFNHCFRQHLKFFS